MASHEALVSTSLERTICALWERDGLALVTARLMTSFFASGLCEKAASDQTEKQPAAPPLEKRAQAFRGVEQIEPAAGKKARSWSM